MIKIKNGKRKTIKKRKKRLNNIFSNLKILYLLYYIILYYSIFILVLCFLFVFRFPFFDFYHIFPLYLEKWKTKRKNESSANTT